MHRIRFTQVGLVALAAVLLLPVGVFAQDGSVAGVAADETGAVLPGVTVEASSPALIEGVRVTVSDGSGRFEITALPPGSYSVTFTLAGFNTFIRDGIELTSGFTATVDGTMTVGSIEESVTVTGAAPLVDIQNVASMNTFTNELLDTLPTGKTYWGYAALTVGMNTNIAGGGHDVGGSIGDQWGHVEIHGSGASDGEVSWDGMTFNNNVAGGGGGSAKEFFMNQAAIQEIVVSTASMSAEQGYGGVGINAIPKDGGNQFSYYANISGTNGNFQSDNIGPDLQARGANPLAKNIKIWDYGFGIGGPIVKDRVWFYSAHRWWGTQNLQPVTTINLTPHSPVYTEDPSNPTWTDFYNQDNNIRFTVQASDRHKVTFSQNFQNNCACHFWTHYGITSQNASTDYRYNPVNLTQTTWTFPASNRVLFEAGGSFLRNLSAPRPQDEVRPTDIAHISFVPFRNWNANAFNTCDPCLYGIGHDFPNYVFRGSMSYVTGTHSLKVGFNTRNAKENHDVSFLNGAPLRFTFFTPTFPLQVDQFAHPKGNTQDSFDLGIYVQDQWTVDRLTLNLGVRYDHINGSYPDQSYPGAAALEFFGPPRFVDPFDVVGANGVPSYHDLVPRLGAAYDVAGNGRTAVKVTLGKYILPVGTSLAAALNPNNSIVDQSSRAWNDLPFQGGNGNFIPDCDFDNFAANGECGAIRDPQFGTTQVVETYDPDLLQGWGKREYQWQTSVAVQHEIVQGWSVEVGYFRTWYKNFVVTDNRNIGPEHFSEFSIVAPTDPRLGDYSGQTLDGLYTITPEGQALGQDNFTTLAKNLPGGDAMGQWFDGVDVSFEGRFDNGIRVGGGLSTGTTRFDECFVIDNPTQNRPGYCDVSSPWSAGTQLKLNGNIPLPYDTEVSFVFQNIAGLPWQSIFDTAGQKAAIEAQIGHPIVSGAADNRFPIFPSGAGADYNGTGDFNFTGSELYEKRLTQLDLRFTKIFQFGGARIKGWFDAFNVFNESAATNLVDRYSAPGLPWPGTAQVMGGRLFKFGGQFDF